MSTARKTLIEILEEEFKTHPDNMKVCIAYSQEKIRSGDANRVFDKFPCLVEPNEFAALVESYKEILASPCKNKIRNFEKQIAKTGCLELLERDGKIKDSILELLHWKETTPAIDNYHVISAYVGAMNACLASNNEQLFFQNKAAFSAMMNYVNPNYGHWVLETMRDLGMKYDPSYDTNKLTVSDILLYPVRNPAYALSFVFFGVAGAAVCGVADIAKRLYDDNATLASPDSTNLQP